MSDISALTFVLGRLVWYALAPGHMLILLLVVGAICLAATGGRRGLIPVIAATAGLVAVTVLPLGSWLLDPLESRFPPPAELGRVDGIVLLGGAIEPGAALARPGLNSAADRVVAFAELARRFPEARLVVTSGEAALFPQGRAEAEVTASLLERLGLARDRLLLESQSRNTYENARFAREAAKPAPGERWLLVTSASHMPRAVGSFHAAGWQVIAYPVDFNGSGHDVSLAANLGRVTSAAKEWVGLVAYRLLGRTADLLPGPGPEPPLPPQD